MNRLRVRTTILGGAAIGLVAGAAVLGAVSSSSTPAPFKPALVSTDTSSALPDASCAAGQELEHGVCIAHVEKVVVIPAPAAAPADDSTSAPSPGANSGTEDLSGSSESSEHSTEVGDDDANEAAHEAAEAAHDAAEHATEAAEHSTQDDDS